MKTEIRRFLTVADSDPQLEKLLEGRSDDSNVRPLLLSSMHEWTFEFIQLREIRRPSLWLVWIRALRPESWVLSLGPIAATLSWVYAWTQSANHPFELNHAILAIVGILALHASINLFNDYHDHTRGWDRAPGRGGSQVIRLGWLRALDVRRAAWLTFSLAVAAGLPVVIANFSFGIFLAFFSLSAALEFAISHFGLKYRGFAEVAAWFMFGPLLTGGFAWAMTGRLLWQSFALGSVYGSLALLCFHLKNFERILIDGRAGLKTWPVRAGFEASKTFTYFCLVLISISISFVVVLVDPIPERILAVVLLATGIGPLAHRVYSIKSPVGGRMRGLYRAGLYLAWGNLLAFAIGDCLR